MKIAIVNDYLVSYGGAEKTFKALTDIFPDAEIYTLFYASEIKQKFFPTRKVHTSFLQKFPRFLRKHYQLLLPFLPVAAETLDFRNFDIVISSSHSFVKGIITRPKTTHICYCYSPTRYLWDKAGRNVFLNYFRIWDRHASERVDDFIACSKTVQNRIRKYYKRDSTIIYPPVQISPPEADQPLAGKHEFYLIVSQLRKYKRIDLAIDAFNKLGLNLVIIGEGPEKSALKQKAGKNIKFLGWLPDEKVAEYYQNCAGFIFPSEDDFGIAPVEAMSYGKPVLAFRKGGATETIIEGRTGEFFDSCLPAGRISPAVLADGIRRMRQKKYDPEFISQHAKKFSADRFEKEILNYVNIIAKEHQI